MSDGDHASLHQAVSQYIQVLVAATIPSPQGRQIPDTFGALELSKATDELHLAIARAVDEVSVQFDPESELPPTVRLEESASPDGPWKPIPPEAIRVHSIPLKKGDPHVASLGATMRAAFASGFPVGLWKALQAASPGDDHNRYRPGDLVSQQDYELAASAERLLELLPKGLLSSRSGPSDSRPVDAAKIVVLRRPSQPSRQREPDRGAGDRTRDRDGLDGKL